MRKLILVMIALFLFFLTSCNMISTTQQILDGTNRNDTTTTTTREELQIPDYGSQGFVNQPEYNGIITIRAATPLTCEESRCYRQVYSSSDLWLGMEMTIILPYFTGDENHFAKIYFSTISSGHQSDLGLVLSNTSTPTYHIFWEDTINNTTTPVITNGDELEHKYFPGDKIRMSVFSTKQNNLKLLIELLEPTKDPLYQDITRREDAYISLEFISNQHDAKNAIFKRIVSIEKITENYGEARLTDALIIETWLYRLINQEVYKMRFDSSSRSSNDCGDYFNFIVTYDNRVRRLYGGEILNIIPKEREGE